MIIFHEGLPRSGKSYEAMLTWIIPSLKEGRAVYSNIHNMNHEKIAEVAGLHVNIVNMLLHQLNDEQVLTLHDHVKNDSLVVLDELQNYFPSGRQKLTPEMTKFVTEHGHLGLDIITMGQSLNDCHALWKRRTQTKMSFLKLSAVGKEDSYKWTAYNGHLDGKGEVRFIKANSGVRKYDPKYFGTYASHEDATKNKSNLKNSRTNIFNNKAFKIGIPAFACVLAFAIWTLIDFFTPDENIKNETIVHVDEPTKPNELDKKRLVSNQALPRPVANKPPPPPPPPKPIDYLDKQISKYRPRLSAFMESDECTKNHVTQCSSGIIDFLDSSFHLKERLTFEQIRDMGWTIEIKSYGANILKKDKRYVITSWPMDAFGKVAKKVQDSEEVSGKL